MALKTKISNITSQRRQQIKALQDEFTTFSWGGDDAFENFGAFIINDKKGSLKFYNGASFSNEYTSPQFGENGGYLQGVTFKQQTIDFTIGVYWFSIEDYRRLLKWLDPLKVDYLQFGFAPKYRYDVKLAKRTDTTRWVVGKENGEPRYYTEMQLSFDVQGTPCAKGMNPYEFSGNYDNPIKNLRWSFQENNKQVIGSCHLFKNTGEYISSDLETPVQINFTLGLASDNVEANYFYNTHDLSVLGTWENNEILKLNENNSSFNEDLTLELDQVVDSRPAKYELSLLAAYEIGQDTLKNPIYEEVNLCSFTLQHLTLFTEKNVSLYFTYQSETGLVFLKTDNISSGNLLTLQTFTDSGDFLVESLESKKFMLPGELDYPGFYSSDADLKFILKITKKVWDGSDWITATVNRNNYEQPISIECYPRTNVI